MLIEFEKTELYDFEYSLKDLNKEGEIQTAELSRIEQAFFDREYVLIQKYIEHKHDDKSKKSDQADKQIPGKNDFVNTTNRFVRKSVLGRIQSITAKSYKNNIKIFEMNNQDKPIAQLPTLSVDGAKTDFPVSLFLKKNILTKN